MTTADTSLASTAIRSEQQPAAIALKGSVFTLTILSLLSNDLERIEHDLKIQLARNPQFFQNAPLVIDLEYLEKHPLAFDFTRLVGFMRRLQLFPVGIRNGDESQKKAALMAGLAVMQGGSGEQARPAASTPGTTKTKPPVSHQPQAATQVIQQPIRSGQQVYAKDKDLIVLAAVNAGSEIVADGHIHVYAPLRGKAFAGAKGNTQARIFCHCMEAELVSIAGNYQVFEDDAPTEFSGRPMQIFLQDEQLKFELLA